MSRSPFFSLLVCAAALLAGGLSLRAQDAEGIFTTFDEPPAPVRTEKPRYPSDLQREGVSGVVSVKTVIDESGKVLATEVTKSSNPAFDTPAMDAVKKWKFKPAKKDGNVVKSRVTIPVRFLVEE